MLLFFAFVAAAASAQTPTPPFDRTIIVGGSGTPAANGAALQFAIADAATGATAANPWLVKVEPGIFELGGGTIAMRNFVDIEGSGRNATFITTAGNGFTLVPTTLNVAAGVDAEIRNLTLRCINDGDSCASIVNESTELKATQLNLEVEAAEDGFGFLSTNGNPRLSAIFARVSAKEGDAVGMEVRRGGPIVNEMFVFIKKEVGAAIGWRLLEGTTPIIEQVSATILGGDNSNYGFRAFAASPRITNARINIVADSSLSIGYDAQPSSFVNVDALHDIKESTFTVRSKEAIGLSSNRQTVTVQDTLFAASSPASASAGVFAQNSARVFADQSILRGRRSVQLATSALFRGGSSQLDGTRSFAAGTSAVCAASYTGGYVPVAASCL